MAKKKNSVLRYLDYLVSEVERCTIISTELYANYCAWCKSNDEIPVSYEQFEIDSKHMLIRRYEDDGIWYNLDDLYM